VRRWRLKVALNHQVVEGPFPCHRTPELCLKKSTVTSRSGARQLQSLLLPFLFFIDSRKRKLSLFSSPSRGLDIHNPDTPAWP
jgi:hypothetical protein